LNWNPKNNSYCKYVIWIGGDYRSPEELDGEPIDEKSDVWPLGANIFALLSGLFPYYTVMGTKLIEEIIANGTRPYLDPRYRERSLIEGGLYDIMQQCFEVEPEDRVDIFSVVRHLRAIQDDVTKELTSRNLPPYNGDAVMRELARHIVSAEKMKMRQKELYFAEHGSLDGFQEASSYGEYGGDDDGGGNDDTSGDDGF
jgi:serine/threonine protein kinase